MSERRILPQRRPSTSFVVEHVSLSGSYSAYSASASFFEDGSVGEVFMSNTKAASDLDVAARDSAILFSFCLQYGARLEDIAAALTRDESGAPQGIAGSLADAVIGTAKAENGGGSP